MVEPGEQIRHVKQIANVGNSLGQGCGPGLISRPGRGAGLQTPSSLSDSFIYSLFWQGHPRPPLALQRFQAQTVGDGRFNHKIKYVAQI